MKITRRKDRPKSGSFLVSVQAGNIERVESALTYLKDKSPEPLSTVLIHLIEDAARRAGWTPPE